LTSSGASASAVELAEVEVTVGDEGVHAAVAAMAMASR
jgi:hypothetical protein